MKILFDQNVTRKLRRSLVGDEVRTAREMGWDRLADDDLLEVAGLHGFDVLITGDKKLVRQQSDHMDRMPILVLGSTDWAWLESRVALVREALLRCRRGSYEEVPFEPW